MTGNITRDGDCLADRHHQTPQSMACKQREKRGRTATPPTCSSQHNSQGRRQSGTHQRRSCGTTLCSIGCCARGLNEIKSAFVSICSASGRHRQVEHQSLSRQCNLIIYKRHYCTSAHVSRSSGRLWCGLACMIWFPCKQLIFIAYHGTAIEY